MLQSLALSYKDITRLTNGTAQMKYAYEFPAAIVDLRR